MYGFSDCDRLGSSPLGQSCATVGDVRAVARFGTTGKNEFPKIEPRNLYLG